ncbi:hypothetical protein Lal_00044694, partial [Lupinus albus]
MQWYIQRMRKYISRDEAYSSGSVTILMSIRTIFKIKQEVWELQGDSRLSERSSPKRGTQCCSH